MSLEFIDGFDHYDVATSNGALQQKWDTDSGQRASPGFLTGRFGGNALSFWDTPGVHKALTAQAGRTVGFAFKIATFLPSSALAFFEFRDGTTAQIDLRLNPNGTISVTRAGTVLATSTGAIIVNTWYYIEFQAVISASDGSFTLRVTTGGANTIWAEASGVNTSATGTAYSNSINFLWNTSATGNGTPVMDDVYCLNSDGETNNTFLGESRIVTILPDADSAANAQWTPSSGASHSAMVDDTPNPDGDTTYVSSDTAGQIDTYSFATPAGFTGAIAAVQNVLSARKDDVGNRTFVSECRSGAANCDGATEFSPTSSYLMYREIYETDPATGEPWTLEGLEAAEFGAKVIA